MAVAIAARNLDSRTQAREWIKDAIEQSLKRNGSASQPEITNKAVEHFSRDAEFIKLFLAENLRPIVYSVVTNVVGGSRVRMGDAIVDREKLRSESVTSSRWGKWLEHVGNKQIRLTDMTRGDLLAAAAERETRIQPEVHTIRLWRALAAGMETDHETVGLRFSGAEIDRAYASISVEERI